MRILIKIIECFIMFPDTYLIFFFNFAYRHNKAYWPKYITVYSHRTMFVTFCIGVFVFD